MAVEEVRGITILENIFEFGVLSSRAASMSSGDTVLMPDKSTKKL
jgi:hypothetical protein